MNRYLLIGMCSVLALLAVYLLILLAEFVAGEGLVTRSLGPNALPKTAVAAIIHAVITVPASFGLGFGLVRFTSGIGLRAVMVVALLWTALVTTFQLAVYEPNVAGLSVLKVVCVVGPLLAGGAVARRLRPATPHASDR